MEEREYRGRGAWGAAVSYVEMDVVSYGHMAYLCIIDNINIEPPDETYWREFASLDLTDEPNTQILRLNAKESCVCASITNVVLPDGLEAGNLVDGVVLVAGDRVLLKNQTAGEENGIYNAVASGAANRSFDADIDAEVTQGMYAFVAEGTVNGGDGFILITADPIILNTTPLSFTQFSGAGQITAGSGMTKTGDTLNVIGGDGITANDNDIAVDADGILDGSTNKMLTTGIQTVQGAKTFTGATKFGDGTTNYVGIATNGELEFYGTARTKKPIWLSFNALKAPGLKPAILIDQGVSGAWQFADGADDTIIANIQIPPDMDRAVAPILKIGWSTNTVIVTETAVWQVEYLYTAEGEDTTAAAQDTKTVQSNAIAQADGMILVGFAALNLIGADDVCLHMRVKRLGADGNDDLTDTAELHGLCIEYTSNKLGIPL